MSGNGDQTGPKASPSPSGSTGDTGAPANGQKSASGQASGGQDSGGEAAGGQSSGQGPSASDIIDGNELIKTARAAAGTFFKTSMSSFESEVAELIKKNSANIPQAPGVDISGQMDQMTKTMISQLTAKLNSLFPEGEDSSSNGKSEDKGA